MGQYKKSKTAAKVVIPPALIIGGSALVQLFASLAGQEISDDMSYKVVTSIYAVGAGIINWWKNR